MTAPTIPPSADAPPAPLVDPRARDWDETPAEAARYDRAWFDEYEYDQGEDE